MGAWWLSMGSPSDVRSFDPFRIADLEYRMWVGYYQRRWTAGAGRVGPAGPRWASAGTGCRTLRGAWLMLRAVQLCRLRSPDN